ncbi:MAG: pyroglutamyl-peptidase I [Planctomycetota bacterium]|nr:pyroglutamyl-peptidase I [Planctomycetota bacterium]
MSSVLITAFEPYDVWKTNSSWLTLVELTRDLPDFLSITTRLYPVEYGALRQRLEADFERPYDVILHLGQAPGSSGIQFESIAVNVASERNDLESWPLIDEGPLAYRSKLPLEEIVRALRSEKIPATVSYHAGTYLCNAAMYWSHYLAELRGYRSMSTMIHLPLETTQVVDHGVRMPSLPACVMAEGIRRTLEEIKRAGAEKLTPHV